MNKARAFNPFLCAKTDKLMTLIAEVQTQMSGYEAYYGTRKRARRPADQVTYDRTVEAILCDLCAVELGSENDSIHLPLSNKVLRSKSRYKGTALGKTLPDILKVMSAPEMSFVVVEKGHSTFKIVDDELNVAFAGGQQTILKAGPKLLSRIERFEITKADMGHAPEEEVLILRAPKRHSNSIAEYQEYEDDEATLALRQQMTSINDWLSTADITCNLPQMDPAHRRLRRIFNNSDFGQGGRLYGGFWQAMSSDERQEHILIEGDCCVELDYGQMSLTILYGIAGKPPPEGDLYDLSAEGIPTDYRKGLDEGIFGAALDEKIANASAVLNVHFSAGVYTEYPRLLSAYLAGKPLVSETLSPELEEGRHYIALGAQTNVEYFAKTFANFSAEFAAHNRFTDFLASYAK